MPKPFDINYLLDNIYQEEFFDIVKSLEYYNLFDKYTVNKIKSIASNQISIDLNNYSGSIEMIRDGSIDIVDLNHYNVEDIYNDGYCLYFYILLRDYIYDGDMYTTERITISETYMNDYMYLLLDFIESMNDIPTYFSDIHGVISNKALTDALVDIMLDEDLDDTIHKAGPVKPELKISNMKKINTNSWWN